MVAKKLSPQIRDQISFLVRMRKWMFWQIISAEYEEGVRSDTLCLNIIISKKDIFPLPVGMTFVLKLDNGQAVKLDRTTTHYIHADGSVS
jgi:hypothetical protein